MSRLRKCRKDLEDSLIASGNCVHRCNAAICHTAQRPALTLAQKRWIYELAMLKSFVALEVFLEVSFGLYVIGEKVPGHPKPQRITKVQGSLPRALQVLRGDKDFVGWNSPSVVTERAERWFRSGEPFRTALTAGAQMLSYIRSARNCVAHNSESAEDDFVDRTRKVYGSVPIGLTVGGQLMGAPPASIVVFNKATLLEECQETMRAIASNVVP